MATVTEEYLTPNQAAARLGVRVREVYDLMRDRKLTPYAIDRRPAVSAEEVQAIVDAR